MTGDGVFAVGAAQAVRERDPVLDGDGLLRFRGRWVAVPDAQLLVAELLVERYGCTVPDADLTTAYARSSPGAGHRAYINAMHRLGRRVRGCGLELRRVRTRGFLLEARPTESSQERADNPSDLLRDPVTSLTPI